MLGGLYKRRRNEALTMKEFHRRGNGWSPTVSSLDGSGGNFTEVGGIFFEKRSPTYCRALVGGSVKHKAIAPAIPIAVAISSNEWEMTVSTSTTINVVREIQKAATLFSL